MRGRTNRTPENEAAFLEALTTTANVTQSCEMTGIARSSAYEWREADEAFAAAWDKALERGTDALEDEAVRRGRDGTLKPVFYQGQECGQVREYSDTLLIFMLKARRPEKFLERSSVTTNGVVTNVNLDASDPVEASRIYQDLIKGA